MRAGAYGFIRSTGDVRRLFSGLIMRRNFVLLSILAAAATSLPASSALAQYGQGRPGQDSQDQEAAAAKKKNDDWNLYQAPLTGKRGLAPCGFMIEREPLELVQLRRRNCDVAIGPAVGGGERFVQHGP